MEIAEWKLHPTTQMLKDEKTDKKAQNQLNEYARYSSIAFKMLAVIGLGVFFGYKLDIFLRTSPLLIVIFSMGSVALAIYSTIRDFLKEK